MSYGDILLMILTSQKALAGEANAFYFLFAMKTKYKL